MLSKNATLRGLYVLMLLAVALAVSACGSDSGNPPPTQVPTAAATPTAAPTPTEESDEGGGVMSSVRSVPGKVKDGLIWILKRGSDGVNTVWDGLRKTGDFLWDRVTGLPSAAWDVITNFWQWVFGINLGEIVVSTIEWPIEQIRNLNPVGFLQRLLIGFLKVVGIIGLIVLIIVGVFRWGLWMHIARLFWGSAERGLSSIPTPSPVKKKPPVAKTIAFKPAPTREQPVTVREPERDHVKSFVTGPSDIAGDTWSRSQIHELRELVTNQTIIVLFGRASRTDGKPVSDIDLMRATGRSRVQIHTDFLYLARLCRIVHPEGVLPVETIAATAEGSTEAYVIPDQYLEWWFEDQG